MLREQDIRVNDSEELKILIDGLTFTKNDYSTGQLVYICKKYGVFVEQYIDYPTFHKFLLKLKLPKNLKLVNKRIDKRFLKEKTKRSPIIIYVDKYYLDGIYHYSHFVILESLDNKNAVVFDPWDGKEKSIKTQILIRSIQSLRNKLKISPKAITMNRL